jgi:hypothetical protein
MFEQRKQEQTERHDGGPYWIGTGGKSPLGQGGHRRRRPEYRQFRRRPAAVRIADARSYRPYRSDVTLDIRQMEVALRRLRAFVREGADEELDIEATIDETARNAGEIEVVTRPPSKPNTHVILMIDVGGSMFPYTTLMSQLFSATKKATHFKELRTFYFHNCVYGKVYGTERFTEPIVDPRPAARMRSALQADHGRRRVHGPVRARAVRGRGVRPTPAGSRASSGCRSWPTTSATPVGSTPSRWAAGTVRRSRTSRGYSRCSR